MVKQPQWTDAVLSGEAKGCPISMELNLESTEVNAGEFVAVNWTVTLEKERFRNSSNAIKQGAIARIVDESSGELVDVIHSNIHSCAFGSNCDPFRMGRQFVDNTPNKVGNFSQNGSIAFTSRDELLFPEPGTYSVLAHIIIPSDNATSERYDYAVYQRLRVKEKATAAASSADSTERQVIYGDTASSSGDFSTSGLIIGIAGGIVAVTALVLLFVVVKRRRAKEDAASVLSPNAEARSRTLRPVDKTISAFNSSSLPVLGHERLGAPRPAPYSRYLTSTDHAAQQPLPSRGRGTEMDIREFDGTYDNTASYLCVPENSNKRDSRSKPPHRIVDSTFSMAEQEFSTTSSRMFSSASEGFDGDDVDGFGDSTVRNPSD